MTRPIAGRRRLLLPALCLAIAAAAAGCGKKGPPLAPLVLLPAAPGEAAVRARGEVASFQFRVPDANADKTAPADLVRVDVYGYTGTLASEEDLLKHGTRVASVSVQPPRNPDEEEAASEPPPAAPPGTVAQGEVVVVREPLGEAQRQPGERSRKDEPVPPPPPETAAPLQPPALPALPTRVYAAVGVNHRGRRGAFSEKLAVPLVDAPSAPSAPLASHDEKAISLRWVAPPDARRPSILPVAEGDEVLPAKAIGMPAVAGGYNVYLVDRAPSEGVGRDQRAQVPVRGPMAAPLNAALLAESSFEDPALEFGKERCYVVRAVSVFGPLAVESEASPPACLTPADRFPPEAPSGLAAVGSEGAISLIWEGAGEGDLQGYLVLRAEAGGELRPITPEPIEETTYRDAGVKAGVRYTYVVVAVDRAGNRSEPSARVEETAR